MIAEREGLEKGRISDAYNYLAGGAQKFTEGMRNIGADIKAGQAARKETKATAKDQRDFDAMTPDAQAANPNYVQEMANKRQRELGAAQNLAAQNALAPPQLANQNQPAQNPPAQNPPAPAPAQQQPAQQQPAPAAQPAAGGNQMQNAANQMAFGADAAALARGRRRPAIMDEEPFIGRKGCRCIVNGIDSEYG